MTGRWWSIPRDMIIPLLSYLTVCHLSSPKLSPTRSVFSVKPMNKESFRMPFSEKDVIGLSKFEAFELVFLT